MAESIVYGCIRDMVGGGGQAHERRLINRSVMESLPSADSWPLLSREMFAPAPAAVDLDEVHTDVIHFGSSYKAIEHEWNTWIKQFERVLRGMYWVSATVHLETLYNGIHTFVWETDSDFHEPNSSNMAMRCEWTHETSF
jgi:hypothetical protein|tara:strand:- start:457 stop:876 length:420 start_codon:yes stop_codon:yes gene_type:complete